MGPSPIINIKKEKRETEEETKEILAKLERDTVSPLVVNFIKVYYKELWTGYYQYHTDAPIWIL